MQEPEMKNSAENQEAEWGKSNTNFATPKVSKTNYLKSLPKMQVKFKSKLDRY